MTQDKPAGIAPAPGTEGKKPDKWDVNARHASGRDVQIDTRTGTWMSLDVSPDGREIAFDLLTVCDVVFIRKGHGGLDLLTEARVVERFPHLRADLRAIYAGYYAAELLADGTQVYDPHPPLFDATTVATFARTVDEARAAGLS